MPSLQHLETSNCWHLTDAGLTRLTALTTLAHLDLSYCWQVRGTPLQTMEGTFSSLSLVISLVNILWYSLVLMWQFVLVGGVCKLQRAFPRCCGRCMGERLGFQDL